ncbi:MAG: DOPA 4,5-dioxygenase family protein [Pseudomonadota bacterium]
MDVISGFHAHVYFDERTIDKARALCETVRDRFDVEMGRVHEKPVGPHPDWSCQLAFPPEKAGDVIAYLAINRDGLVVFIHPETGDDLADHTRHAIWMGTIRPLNTSMFD